MKKILIQKFNQTITRSDSLILINWINSEAGHEFLKQTDNFVSEQVITRSDTVLLCEWANSQEGKGILAKVEAKSEAQNLLKVCKTLFKNVQKKSIIELPDIFTENVELFDQILNLINRSKPNLAHQISYNQDKIGVNIVDQFYSIAKSSPNGNCLFNSLAILFFDSEAYFVFFKILSAVSLMMNFEIFKKIKDNELTYNQANDCTISNLIYEAINDAKWGNMYHLQSLALILNRPIYCFGNFENIEKTMKINAFLERVKNGRYCGNHMKYLPISDENNFAPILLYFNKSHFDPILAIYDDSPIIEPKYAPFTWN